METTDYQKQAIDFLNATNTSFTTKYKTHGKHFADDTVGRDIYRCKLKNDLHSYSFDFGQSIANQGTPPTAYDVLACLQKYDPDTYEYFCDEFGYDRYDTFTGRKNKIAVKIYNSVCREWEAIEKLFSQEQIEILQEIQ
jgi:hypothetical protein